MLSERMCPAALKQICASSSAAENNLIVMAANIAKVESRGKIYFDYAETKHIYEP